MTQAHAQTRIAREFGGAARIRTGDGGFADLCLTTWLRRQPEVGALVQGAEIWSGKRDSNPRLRPWQGRTLPLSYSRSCRATATPKCSTGSSGARNPRGRSSRQRASFRPATPSRIRTRLARRPRRPRLAEQGHAQDGRPGGADARPHGVRGANRQRPCRGRQAVDAGRQQHERRHRGPQPRPPVGVLEPGGPGHLQNARNHQPCPRAHRGIVHPSGVEGRESGVGRQRASKAPRTISGCGGSPGGQSTVTTSKRQGRW